MGQIQAKKIVSYVVLPGVVPRARKLFASGFGRIAFLMAEIYAMVRLLPRNHPYLNPQNIGQYGLRHVIAAAANHLVIKKENIDQIIVFFALLMGTVLLLMQFVFLIYSLAIQPAAASIFVTANPQNDIAFILLDKVFGIPDFFCNPAGVCSKINGEIPYPFHTALHSLLQFYSKGLLIVACLIFLYFVVVVTAETATTGSPFGQRFQNVWVPIRLIVAIGLLLPLNYGLNSAQYITLAAAKYGSGMATNTWLTFNRTIKEHALFTQGRQNPLGEYDSLVGMPKPADASILTEMMSLVHSCAYAYWVQKGPIGIVNGHNYSENKTVFGNKYYLPIPPDERFFIKPYLVKKPNPLAKNQEEFKQVTNSTTYVEALDFYNNQDIIIRFGRQSEKNYKSEPGFVEPTCGEIRIPVVDIANKGKGKEVGGADYMLWRYFTYIKEMWFTQYEFHDFAQRFMQVTLKPNPTIGGKKPEDTNGDLSCFVACSTQPNDHMADCFPAETQDTSCADSSAGLPTQKWKQHVVDQYNANFLDDLVKAWAKYAQTADIEIKDDVLALGWGGAGVWYNTIAKLNGLFVTSVMATPKLVTYPLVMEKMAEYNRRVNQSSGGLNQYSPLVGGKKPPDIGTQDDLEIAIALNDVYEFWHYGGRDNADQGKTNTANAVLDVMNLLFGTAGIFSIREENAHIHPMAQLSTIGKGLVESAIQNIMGASASAFLGGALSVMSPNSGIGKLASAMGQFLQSVAFIGLTAGVILFYILPFLPFLYFFFAVGEWVKAIFEAMVGVPLWAMAHLRLDGEGLPGEAAKDGYFLIMEIFLRPVLTVIALIAATVIFTAQARILNSIWDLVLSTSVGYEANPTIVLSDFIEPIPRSTVDEFFYTLVYTFVLYMMATSAFKLINQIPDNLLRWAGAGVSAFGDINNQDPLAGLQRYAAIGGMTIGRQAVGAATSAASGMGQAAGQLGRTTPQPPGRRGG